MKKRRRLKKKIRNRLILAFGLLIALFILITLILKKILYIIFDYSHKHYTFKQFEV